MRSLAAAATRNDLPWLEVQRGKEETRRRKEEKGREKDKVEDGGGEL